MLVIHIEYTPLSSWSIHMRRAVVRKSTRPQHPVLHGEPFAPIRLGCLYLFFGNALEGAEEGHRLAIFQVIAGLDSQPSLALGCEEVISSLILVYGADASVPGIAEEAV